MRKLVFSFLLIGTFFLTGCLETTQEITINDDGSGSMSLTNDMGKLIGIARQMGGGSELDKAGKEKMDSVISLAAGADNFTNLSAAERDLVRAGTVRINMDIAQDKFLTVISFPFKKTSDIPVLNALTSKVMGETMKGQAQKSGAPGMDEMPEVSSLDEYYKLDFTEGELTKKVNKDKYAGVESDEFLQGMKQAMGMGIDMKTTLIIHLPRPAQKAEGKNVQLSEDKKKVTITSSVEDFFEDASALEFKIKY